MEKCPDRFLTLVNAKIGKKEDQDYYRRYCKEGVDFAKSVNEVIPWIMLCTGGDEGLTADICRDSES